MAWITDFRHLPTSPGENLEAWRFAEYQRWIVGAASAWAPMDQLRETGLPCRRKPKRRMCPGRIQVLLTGLPPEVRWICSSCKDQGIISNWAGSDADMTKWIPTTANTVEVDVTSEEYGVLLACQFPASERLVLGAFHDEEIVLVGSKSEFAELAGWLAGEANHARPGRRERLLSDLYEKVESVA